MADPKDIALLVSSVVTSVGTLWGIYQAIYTERKRNRLKIKLIVREGQYIRGGTYDPQKQYTHLRVVNRGEKKIKVATIGAEFLLRKGGITFAESIHNGITPVEPGDIYDVVGVEDGEGVKLASYFVTLATGEVFMRYNYPRLLVWILRPFRKKL